MPVYKTEATVVRAIESVLAQTDPNFELLVLIDGSPDDSARVIAEYLQHHPDNRVRVFDNPENRGVSAVRNQGLSEARGDWIAFLDSDDRLEPHFLETLHTYARESGADIAIGAHTLTEQDGTRTVRARTTPGLYTGEQASLKLLDDSLTPYLWDKLFAAETLSGVHFPEDIHRAEDAVVVLAALTQARFVVACAEPVYLYTVDAGGLTWGRITPLNESERLMDYLTSAAQALPASGARSKALTTQRVLTFLNNAQQALVVGGDESGAVIRGARQKISWAAACQTLATRPIFGAAAVLLKASPDLYRILYGAYIKRVYGL